jgi:glycosyltransferase involved in cell wall biosynthesis
MSDPKIKTCFIGRGEPIADRDYMFYKGTVSHDELPVYLNAADVFVLPTLREGCCNAIVEALACGLPVISSDRSFNYDILDETNSILVDPDDVNQIAKAIKLLSEDKNKRDILAKGALDKAMSLSIDQRASNILNFILGKL